MIRMHQGPVHPLACLGHPVDTVGLAEGEAAPLEGRNDFGGVSYRGPCLRGRGCHRCRFRLNAVTEGLRLAPGAGVARLEQMLRDNVLAVAAFVGAYER
jgi:phosphatidylethanolamine-binding protein (PEBP) family uncharacterized protein